MKTFIIIFFALGLGSFTSTAEQISTDEIRELKNIQKWNAFEISDLQEYAEKLETGIEWPRLESKYFCENEFDSGLAIEKQKFSDHFLRILIAYSLDFEEIDLEEFKSDFAQIVKIRDAAFESGGYRGILLSSAIHRVLSMKLARMISVNLDQYKEMAPIVKSLRVGDVNIPALLEHIQRESELIADRKEIGVVISDPEVVESSQQNFYLFLDKLEKRLPDDIKPRVGSVMLEKRPFSELFEGSDPYRLLDDKLTSGIISDSILPGLLKFIEKGGDIAKLAPHDTVELERVMAEEKWNFGYPILTMEFVQGDSMHLIVSTSLNKKAWEAWMRSIFVKAGDP